jgi:hypothetical protein
VHWLNGKPSKATVPAEGLANPTTRSAKLDADLGGETTRQVTAPFGTSKETLANDNSGFASVDKPDTRIMKATLPTDDYR